jgi:hypothetical protein
VTDENPEVICERIVAGETLRDICRDDPDMESLATVSRWLGEEASTAFSLPRARRRVEAIRQLMGALAPEEVA